MTLANALRREGERHGDRNDVLSWRLQDAANAAELAETLTKKAARILYEILTAYELRPRERAHFGQSTAD